jgi:hypothetical protein
MRGCVIPVFAYLPPSLAAFDRQHLPVWNHQPACAAVSTGVKAMADKTAGKKIIRGDKKRLGVDSKPFLGS